MQPFQNILIATDFSSGSRAALAEAGRLAHACDATLHVVHVYPKNEADAARAMFSDVAGSVQDYLSERVEEQLRSELTEAGVTPDHAKCYARVGRVVDEVCALVDEIGADLLVIGATGEGDRRWGTMAGRLVRRGPTRVLLIPPGCRGPFGRIVASVDFSDLSPEVIDQAAGLARLDGGKVSSIHCYELPWERARFGGAIPENALEVEEQYHGMLQKEYESSIGQTPSETPPPLHLLRDVDAGRSIVKFANDTSADLVVTGTTGRSKLGYVLLGTTAEKVMRDTPCAVLAIKSPKGPGAS